jgi:phosphoribosylamine--glycine ligase
MRFLGIGEWNSLGDMYDRLQAAGHEVRVFVEEPGAHEIFRGRLMRVDDWRTELSWVRAAGRNGVIIFESAAMGGRQDALRRDGFNVIGGSAYGDRLEADRRFGQQVLAEIGLGTAVSETFHDFDRAGEFLDRRPGRYVFKLHGTSAAPQANYVGEAADGRDMRDFLAAEAARRRGKPPPTFSLMQFIEGVEVGVGAYFDGERFLEPALLDWEHKRFFNGDLGELTPEMGTVVTYRGAERLFGLTLARLAERLRGGGYCGYINLNTIVNEQGIWPLEFTCRFGYPGFAICDALHAEGWDSIFAKMIARQGAPIETKPGYAVGVVLTVPPFPYEEGYATLSKGLPIRFDGASVEELARLHLADVEWKDGVLTTSGMIGYLMVATGSGDTVERAQEQAYALARKVVVPNLRYRTDIGDKFRTRDRALLETLGYLPR